MTEYWVSQGNKWCDYCKIYIANNATSIRTHEFGTRHKENVAKKLAAIRKDNATKEKEKTEALKDLERIEAQARKSYAKDLAAIQRADVAAAAVAAGAAVAVVAVKSTKEVKKKQEGDVVLPSQPFTNNQSGKESVPDWTYDEASGYHFNAATGYYYDPNSGLYYSDILGKWTTQEAALKASHEAQLEGRPGEEKIPTKNLVNQSKVNSKVQSQISSAPKIEITQPSGPPALKVSSVPPGSVMVNSQAHMRGGKGIASSLEVAKRKRNDKPGPISGEEAAALAAREAARKRTLEREKSLLGLYQAYS